MSPRPHALLPPPSLWDTCELPYFAQKAPMYLTGENVRVGTPTGPHFTLGEAEAQADPKSHRKRQGLDSVLSILSSKVGVSACV